MTVQVGTMVGCIGSGDFGITTILKDQPAQRTTLLVVLDGFGHRDAIEHNAISAARTPNWDRFLATRPHTLISASGADVGLPGGQMGNSEVGHMNLGAGRVVPQDLSRIDRAVELGELETNPALGGLFDKVLNAGGALHVLGLLSPGGVHSHEAQIFELLRVAAGRGLKQIHLHAFLDGRDTPPKSAMASLEKAQGLLGELGVGRVGSITGRYYAMDRDDRWERSASGNCASRKRRNTRTSPFSFRGAGRNPSRAKNAS